MGFTMAEILLSLTIIGIVAAITLPSLTGNINERTWNTQRKALYARFSQAISLMPSLNGYGTLKEASSEGASDAVDTAAETFVTDGLAKVLKINNICDSEHLADCGFPEKLTTFAGNAINSVPRTLVELNNMFNSTFVNGYGARYRYSQIDTKVAAFETANGESILTYYNPYCVADMGEFGSFYSQPKMCANFVYDLNGKKGPNTVGKDIGVITVLYPSDSVVVAPVPLAINAGVVSQVNAGKACKAQDSESRAPNREEVAAMFYNKILFDMGWNIWSSTVISANGENYGVCMYYDTGHWALRNRNDNMNLRCVKR